MFANKSPFSDVTNLQVMNNIIDLKDRYYFFNDVHISNGGKDFITCCLRINPKMRKNIFELEKHPFVNIDQSENKSSVSRDSSI